MAVSKDELLQRRNDVTEEVEVPGVGTVVVRALTRTEALSVTGQAMPVAEAERKLLAHALVEPKLTEDEVARWQEYTAAGELQPVVAAVQRISGLEQHALKEAVKRFRG